MGQEAWLPVIVTVPDPPTMKSSATGPCVGQSPMIDAILEY